MKKSNCTWLTGIILAIAFFWFTSGDFHMASVKAEVPEEVSVSDEALSIIELVNEKRTESGADPMIIESGLKNTAEELLAGYADGQKLSDIPVSGKKGSVQIAQKNATSSGIVNNWMSSASDYLLTSNRGYVAACTKNGIVYAVIVLE